MRKILGAMALVFGLGALGAAAPATADDLAIGGFAHDVKGGVSASPHENGTEDVQLLYRTQQFDIPWLLHPMVYAKAQINTSGRTNFYTLGIEWRKHLFHSRFYGGFGVGGAYVDGYDTYPDHFYSGEQPPPNPTPAQLATYQHDLHIYNTFKAMGSQYVFNPNFTFGYDVSHNIAVELAWDHYSNAGLGGRNPGMDNFGGRLVYRFGGLWH